MTPKRANTRHQIQSVAAESDKDPPSGRIDDHHCAQLHGISQALQLLDTQSARGEPHHFPEQTVLPDDRPHTRSLTSEEGTPLRQFPSEAQGPISTPRPASVAPPAPNPRRAEPVETPHIVLVKPKNDPAVHEPLRQFPTEAPEGVHVRTEIKAPPRQAVRETERFNEAARLKAKAELRSITRTRVKPADLQPGRPHSARWVLALVVAAPTVIVVLFLARPIARLRNLAETAGMAEPAPALDRLVSFPIAVQLSPELQPAMSPPSPLAAVLTVPIRATAPASDPPLSTAPPTPAPSPVGASSSAFHGSLSVISTPDGAQVLVNGVAVGTTPLTLLDVPVGSRVIRIELEGHERWSSAVRIVANEPTTVVAELRPSRIQ